MVEPITVQRMNLLQMVARHPDVLREKLLALKGVAEADLAYLEQHDLMRVREGRCRVSHLGQMALKRGL